MQGLVRRDHFLTSFHFALSTVGGVVWSIQRMTGEKGGTGLVCLVVLVYLVSFVHRTKETRKTTQTRATRINHSACLGGHTEFDVSLLLECIDDSEKVFAARVAMRGRHTMQTLAWFLEDTRSFFKPDGGVDQVAQDRSSRAGLPSQIGIHAVFSLLLCVAGTKRISTRCFRTAAIRFSIARECPS